MAVTFPRVISDFLALISAIMCSALWIHCPVCVLYVDVDFRVLKSIDSCYKCITVNSNLSLQTQNQNKLHCQVCTITQGICFKHKYCTSYRKYGIVILHEKYSKCNLHNYANVLVDVGVYDSAGRVKHYYLC